MYDVSVIIPTYNVEDYIQDTIESLLKQTYKGKMEIIIIDDCSTDSTIEIIEQYKEKHGNELIKLFIQEENMRQGTARNRGLKLAKGKYTFFLDGDDFLDKWAIEKMFEKAEKGNCDFVVCDWAYYYEDQGLVYVNNDKFLFNDYLENEDCERLLEAATYFSVNKLYNTKFLVDNGIKYGEGYIYEDYEFYVEVAQKANKIGLLQNPYYRVRVNENSTTKANRKTLVHINSLVVAVENTINKFEPRADYSYYHLYKYIMKKTTDYVKHRAPFGHKRKTLSKVISILNKKSTTYLVPKKIVPLYHFYFGRKYVQKGKINKLILINNLHQSGKLRPMFQKALKVKRVLLKLNVVSKFTKERALRRWKEELKLINEAPMKENLVLFLGFDYKYEGNSKALFDYMVQYKKEEFKLQYVTTNEDVPLQYRVSPRSIDFYRILAKSKIVIAESWVPLDFPKREGQNWIQLWHGTPFKKLFFDSHERYISTSNPNHKRNKQKDISKWDYILADSKVGKEKLVSAFAVDEEKVLNYGYPRVQWLKDNRENETLKREIKDKLNIDGSKKVILHVPTWRDYNFKTNNLDLSYKLNIPQFLDEVEKDFVFIDKSHPLEPKKSSDSRIIQPLPEMETQELILIADVIISDYSSIIFDGLAVDIPFYLLVNDFAKYQETRGVYEDMSEKLKSFYYQNENDLAREVVAMNGKFDKFHMELKAEYANVRSENSFELLTEKIKEITENKEPTGLRRLMEIN